MFFDVHSLQGDLRQTGVLVSTGLKFRSRTCIFGIVLLKILTICYQMASTKHKPTAAANFMRQFRDSDSRELKKLSSNQFMEVWSHYDSDDREYHN